ncbi:hypothetical protein DW322_06330 [Rhodococcus rhodnii]|uniref:Uncharacterized protein n=2 Tax=Rhodococcus rhodnii TaxID=38312 RepID=R7WSM2_9NOCA|nr:hypothetical protein [Rhodococcus rhodnii]EOM77029.1 hypothetical protein Rrhod_1649 [Rhodococcus rhodnii LMG 5362]TXG89898.1 hypothetical protein DW322_06330 [Rhodococcus rhodnii]
MNSIPATSTTPCTHRWREASRHRTSEGVVVYWSCPCGEQGVTLRRMSDDVVTHVGRPASC